MSKNYLQVRLTDKQEQMKQYLIDKGFNVSQSVREFLIQLYGLEIAKEQNSAG